LAKFLTSSLGLFLGFRLGDFAMRQRRSHVALDTRSARRALVYNKNGYARPVGADVALMYFPSKVSGKNGTWGARRHLGGTKYEFIRFGEADDAPNTEADGVALLDYHHAEARARTWAKQCATEAQKERRTGGLNVWDACLAHIAMKEAKPELRKPGYDCKTRLTRHVFGKPLADVKLSKLRAEHLAAWRAGLAPVSKRGKKIEKLSDATRARIYGDLAAALRAAPKPGGDFLDVVKEGLQKPSNILPGRRAHDLPDGTVKAIVAAARDLCPDFGALVLVLAATGCRFDQARRITVGDVQHRINRIMVPVSHKGNGTKPRSHTAMPLTPGDMEALLPFVIGREPDEILLTRQRFERRGGKGKAFGWVAAGREPWGIAAEMNKLWKATLRAVGLPSKGVTPYALRHASIVRMLTNKMPIRLVAATHDTSVEMIEKTYSHHIIDASEDLLRSVVVGMSGGVAGGEVVPLRRVSAGAA
jgi:integrase